MLNFRDKFLISAANIYFKAFVALAKPDYIFADHNRKIIKTLQQVANGQIKKLIINVAPRSGKSLIVSQLFPAWFLGKFPDESVICATYGQDLADSFGRQVRNLLKTDLYNAIFPAAKLAGDSASIKSFATTAGGVYTASGAGGALTGKGGDCVGKGTIIITEHGPIPVEILYEINYTGKILSFNHKKNEPEFRSIQAYKKIQRNEKLCVQIDSGVSLRVTPEHKIYTRNKGYIETRALRRGDEVVFEPENSMCFMPKNNFSSKSRIDKKSKEQSKGFLLFCRMLERASFVQKQKKMFYLLSTCRKKIKKILLRRMHAKKYTKPEKKPNKGVSGLRFEIREKALYTKILFYGLQKSNAQQNNERKVKSKIYSWESLQSSIFQNEAFDFRKRWELLRCMSKKQKFDGSPHRSRKRKQYAVQSSYFMQKLSCNSPRDKVHTISSVEKDCKPEFDFYDIQVEGNNNFFANGILVHNCIIIDDIHKNRQEANSDLIRSNVIDWYKSTLYTRLSPSGSIVILQTRWHENDLTGYLLEKEPDDWTVIQIPAISDENKSYWPERWPIEKLEEIKKTLGSYEFEALYQQRPSPAGGGMFKKEWFEIARASSANLKKVRYWDRAATISKNGSDPDYTVGIKMGKDNNENFFILDMVRFRGSPLEVENAILNTAIQDGYETEVVLEQDPGQAGIVEVNYLIRKLSGFNVRANRVSTDKITRANPLAAQCEAGNVKLVKGIWNELFLDELASFPYGRHDDIVDAASGAFNQLSKNKSIYEKLIAL